jgi:hypothetical protein
MVGYIAQDTVTMWPNAVNAGIVSEGHGDVNDRVWDDDGNEITQPESWQPWMIDYGRSSAYLHAAVQALDRIVTAQAAEIAALTQALADLRSELAAVRGGGGEAPPVR